jgi:hypothetical protein
MANSTLPERIPELDGLRGAAIAMVVLLHYFHYYPGETHRPFGFIRSVYVHFERFIALGWTGVSWLGSRGSISSTHYCAGDTRTAISQMRMQMPVLSIL